LDASGRNGKTAPGFIIGRSIDGREIEMKNMRKLVGDGDETDRDGGVRFQ
jgi:hypothetical protein